MTLPQKIESYLFYTGEAVSTKKLASIFTCSELEIDEALRELDEVLSNRGIMLVRNGNESMLVTHPDMSEIIQNMRKEELSDPLSKGALETLTIILYKNGATKPEIDFIRGVNSGFMLRNLLVRGLIEKIPNELDKRVTNYRATFETLHHLGIKNVSDLPEFITFQQEINRREEITPEAEENIFKQ